MMEFREILQKLKYSDHFNRSFIAKEILANIQHIHKNELLQILEILYSTSDMEFQVKLLSILSGCILFNNTNRDIIIKWPYLYDMLSTILARIAGLPMKTAVTLNFITSLLYTDDDSGSRNRTLTHHAQSMIRSSGCLTTMTHLFTNSMTYVDTWKALCNCIAEVCSGSVINQSYCSHLVPLCIQRCLRGNLDVFTVLQSLLHNHKRNTELFLKTDGMDLFNRMDFLQDEACLQLLKTVVDNTELELLKILLRQNRIYEYLQNILKIQDKDSRASQWAMITLYYLEKKLRKCRSDSVQYNIRNESKRPNASKVTCVQDKDEIFNDTQILLQNIMSEILSNPPKPGNLKPWEQLYKDSNKRPKLNNISQHNVNETKSHYPEKNCCHQERIPQSSLFNEQLSFSFLLNDNLRDDQLNIANRSVKTTTHNRDIPIRNSTIYIKQRNDSNHFYNKKQPGFSPLHNMEFRKPTVCTKINESVQFKRNQINESTLRKQPDNIPHCDTESKEQPEYNQLCNSFTMVDSQNENVIKFEPAFVSTPIKQSPKRNLYSRHRNTSFRRSFTEGKSKLGLRNCSVIKTGHKRTRESEKDAVKQKSMSSRLLEAINESCTTFIKSVKSVFTGSKISNNQRKDSKNEHTESDSKDESYCSYSFTKYMQKRETELNKQNTKQSDKFEMSTFSNINTCVTCNDTFILKQKMAQDDQLKVTVKKLKLGINLYGCDFKKISKAMWPRETYMTPNVLYNLYRKLLLK